MFTAVLRAPSRAAALVKTLLKARFTTLGERLLDLAVDHRAAWPTGDTLAQGTAMTDDEADQPQWPHRQPRPGPAEERAGTDSTEK